jgi:catechol 2,3-dioxygenase-like lactoylglutathione lyase family enzyme
MATGIPSFDGLTPSLVVPDLARSLAFYHDTLGFEVVATHPREAPFVFIWLRRGRVELFLNDARTVQTETAGGAHYKTGSGAVALYVLMKGIDAFHAALAGLVTVIEPLETRFYGMREFTITDPDGVVITFAEERKG